MGNQNAVKVATDVKQSLMNYLQRLAYAFCVGHILTVILGGNGDMIWDWGAKWEEDTSDQDNITNLVKNLNRWRLHSGKKFIVYGRMLKHLHYDGATNFPMISKQGRHSINFPSVFTSNWESENGLKSQFFVNCLPHNQQIAIDIRKLKYVIIYENSSDTIGVKTADKTLKVTIRPLSAIMMTYSD